MLDLFAVFIINDFMVYIVFTIIVYFNMSSNIAEGATPVLIPNTAVKPFKVDGTAFAREWESRTLLD